MSAYSLSLICDVPGAPGALGFLGNTLRRDDGKPSEVRSEEPAIARQQPVGVNARVSADEKVRDDAAAPAASSAVARPRSSGCGRGASVDRRKRHAQLLQHFVDAARPNPGGRLRPDDVACDDAAEAKRVPKRLGRREAEGWIGVQDVEQDAGVDRGDQTASTSPRSSVSSSSVVRLDL